ncbi:hypothetical protein F3Y22_tig00111648pilonHSYRG00169 [Hibiscus syriacus]|uniref:Uncharacterized protein n=1 Tax=Hibiscus syriacus TaxID=106335 RepID=A0A6A2YFU9_HIBSY|nr:hypothetical protein F3Y22_tig00111648pilonHSYRG00169 [Hibiscus syriacus]
MGNLLMLDKFPHRRGGDATIDVVSQIDMEFWLAVAGGVTSDVQLWNPKNSLAQLPSGPQGLSIVGLGLLFELLTSFSLGFRVRVELENFKLASFRVESSFISKFSSRAQQYSSSTRLVYTPTWDIFHFLESIIFTCSSRNWLESMRDPPIAAQIASFGCNDIAFNSYSGLAWKNKRKVLATELLTSVGLNACYGLRREQAVRAIGDVYENVGKPIDIGSLQGDLFGTYGVNGKTERL